jgi:hypothetical protein
MRIARYLLACATLTITGAWADEVRISDLTDVAISVAYIGSGATIQNLVVDQAQETMSFNVVLNNGVWGTFDAYGQLRETAGGAISDLERLIANGTNSAAVTFSSDPGSINLGNSTLFSDQVEDGTFQLVIGTSGVVNPLNFTVGSDVETPEPSSLAGCALLLFGAAFLKYRRRRAIEN